MSVAGKWFAAQPLQGKLLWSNIATVILSLALMMAIVAGSEWQHARTTLLDDVQTQTRVLGGAASSTLVFDDPAGAREALATLRLSPNVREAVLLRADGSVLARYSRPDPEPLPPLELSAQPPGHLFRESVLDVSQPIYFDHAVVGHLVLRASLDVARERLRWTLFASAAAALVALCVASLLAWRLRHVLVGPILRLAQVTREISEAGDYSRRASIEGADEVGVLARDFNSMIERIERINADLESRVQERTAALTAANRELESFTFATSHDLRGPLGRINSFSALLEQQYAPRLEGDGLLFLGFIRQNALRLTQLVDDLLCHARVAQRPLELQPVEPSSLLRAVLLEKAEDIREAGATIELAVPPGQVLGDSRALTQVLDNLLGNALKYSSPRRQPRIVISGKADAGRFQLAVQDNGIGFDMAYRHKIFEMFHRLHTYREYEGSGIGLALVKRAVERMGGTVWAESQPDSGATFVLELAALDSGAPAA